jgi:hypothetical protein
MNENPEAVLRSEKAANQRRLVEEEVATWELLRPAVRRTARAISTANKSNRVFGA